MNTPFFFVWRKQFWEHLRYSVPVPVETGTWIHNSFSKEWFILFIFFCIILFIYFPFYLKKKCFFSKMSTAYFMLWQTVAATSLSVVIFYFCYGLGIFKNSFLLWLCSLAASPFRSNIFRIFSAFLSFIPFWIFIARFLRIGFFTCSKTLEFFFWEEATISTPLTIFIYSFKRNRFHAMWVRKCYLYSWQELAFFLLFFLSFIFYFPSNICLIFCSEFSLCIFFFVTHQDN